MATYSDGFKNCFLDRFQSISVILDENDGEDDFERKLTECLCKWRSSDVNAVWIKLRLVHSSLIPICVKNGFDFHHAQPGYVMMVQWIHSDKQNTIPEYANQYIGAGGFVVNDQGQLLVVQEKYLKFPHWKLPGGHANTGEDLPETAVREVLEETGIQCEFLRLLAFRHQHQYRYGNSDIYFVCVLRPLTAEITPCEHEISACKWMDLDEYISSPLVSVANRYYAEMYKYQEEQSLTGLKHITAKAIQTHKTRTSLAYGLHPP